MNILILGSGGREHALAWKIARSPLVNTLYVAPGNAGTAEQAINLPFQVTDYPAIENAIRRYHIDMLVVGPEQPLADGIRDRLESAGDFKGLKIIGPGKAGARLESSKDFAKSFMSGFGIPTAAYRTFTAGDRVQATEFLHTLSPPYVLKADGLAAGKGVIITGDLQRAKQSIEDILTGGLFDKAGEKLLIEEYLKGVEMSVFILTDGTDYVLLPEAKDYKRIGEGDTGPNTGGMGAVSPVPFADGKLMKKIENRIIRPTLEGLRKKGIPYTGFLFFGLMIAGGEPYVIEYNVRLGDPETEVILPRIETDLIELLLAVSEGNLQEINLQISGEHAVTVMAVSGGYPSAYEKGKEIHVPQTDKLIFHAGTTRRNAKLLTNGGRVLCVTSFGNGTAQAAAGSYEVLRQTDFEGMYFRRDIGRDVAE